MARRATKKPKVSRSPQPHYRSPPKVRLPTIITPARGHHLALTEIDDRRRYYPDSGVMRKEYRPRPAVSLKRSAARLVVKPNLKTGKWARALTDPIRFADPRRVLVCLRRHARTRVLHALKIAGGGGISRKRRRNEYSEITC